MRVKDCYNFEDFRRLAKPKLDAICMSICATKNDHRFLDLQAKINSKRKLKTLPMERISVLAALDISSDLVKLQSQGAEVIESIDQPESPKEDITKEPEISQTEDPDLQDEDGEDLNFKLVSEISELSKL